MENRRIRGAIFDMDGTLLDTEKLYKRFWMEAAHRLGYPMEERHALMLRGMAAMYADPLMKREICPDFDYYAVRELRRTLMEAYIDEHGVDPKPGLLKTLEGLRARGIRIALATATQEPRARKYLRLVGAEEYLDVFTCASMVRRGKPAPDLFLYAASRLGVAPEEAIGVEDAPSGIRASHAAGLHTIMIPDQDQPDAEISALCEAVLPSLDHILGWIDARAETKICSK